MGQLIQVHFQKRWTLRQARKVLGKKEFHEAFRKWSSEKIREEIAMISNHPEGWMSPMPDAYEVILRFREAPRGPLAPVVSIAELRAKRTDRQAA